MIFSFFIIHFLGCIIYFWWIYWSFVICLFALLF